MNTLFSFYGRTPRGEFWGVALFNFVLSLGARFLGFVGREGSGFVGDEKNADAPFFIALAFGLSIVVLWIGLANCAKRLHDRDKSSWWLLLFFLVPSAGGAAFASISDKTQNPGSVAVICLLMVLIPGLWGMVEMGFRRGIVGPNRYGAEQQ
jgi:uncharacterized membrane protein YhaH (DUF805 family)